MDYTGTEVQAQCRHRGPCVKKGAPVTRPVGVLDLAPPKGCSCIRHTSDPVHSVQFNRPTGADHRKRPGLNLAPTWSNLAVLSSMFVHLVHPGSYLAPTWPIFAPTWPKLAPTWRKLAPTWPNLAPTWSNFAPNLVQHGSKI